MKKVIIFFSTFFVIVSAIGQKTWTSKANGNWNNNSTWNLSGGATGSPPATLNENRVVIITNGLTVTQAVSDIELQGTSTLRIENGGILIMGNAGAARSLNQKDAGTSFIINNGTYEGYSPGSGGNMQIEKGTINWQYASVYISGNYLFKTDVNNLSMIDVCMRAAQNIVFEGVGASGTRAIQNNVYNIAGVSGTGNFTISSTSYFTFTDMRVVVGSTSGYAEFLSSNLSGSIYSIYGNDKIKTQSLSGTTSLRYYCADVLDPNLNYFTGLKQNNCAVAQAQDCSALTASADLSIVKLASPEPVTAGGTLTYTITVTNNGPTIAENVNVVDNLPVQLSVVSATPSVGTWTVPNWNIGTLASGANAVLTIVTTVNLAYTGNLSNMATVSSTTADPVSGNNTSTALSTVVAPTGPTANNDEANTTLSTPVTINVLMNDVAGSVAINPTTVNFVTGTGPNPTTEGTFTVNPTTGQVTFTPVIGYLGTVTIDYNVCDLNNLCDVAKITVNIIEGATIEFPATGFGSLAFEDLWPSKGDYDFNDLLVDYQFETMINTNNFVVKLTGTFVLKSFGASYRNGFGFQLSENIDADDIAVTGFSLTESYISLESNGTESGQAKPTIIVFDNSYSQMAHPGAGIGVNTDPAAPYVTPKTFTINILFEPGLYTVDDLDISNFNPFIIINQVRNKEVHLPHYAPTDLADPSVFGTFEDDSKPATGIYYVTSTNMPWALHIYESFDYPIEKQQILWAHLKFDEWVQSGGTLFTDWYKDLTGYRNTTLIYPIPE